MACQVGGCDGEVAQGTTIALDRDWTLLCAHHAEDPSHLRLNAEGVRKPLRVVGLEDLRDQVPAEMFEPLAAVHRAPGFGSEFDAVNLARAVNALLPLGKDGALAVLTEYERLCRQHRCAWYLGLDSDRLFIILRLLFVRNDGNARMPAIMIGASIPHLPEAVEDWPLSPVVVQHGVPLCLAGGYMLSGIPESPLEHIDFCRAQCRLRDGPMALGDPVEAVDAFLASESVQRVLGDPSARFAADALKRMLYAQAAAALSAVIPENEVRPPGDPRATPAERWEGYRAKVRALGPRWDADRQDFVSAGAPAP